MTGASWASTAEGEYSWVGLQRAARGLLGLLTLQFLLGEWVNLLGSFPGGTPSLGTAIIDGSDPALAAHVVVAVALVFLSLVVFALSNTFPSAQVRRLGGLGFVGIAGAAVGGLSFVYTGYGNAIASYLMAIFFLLAFACYGVLAGATAPPTSGETETGRGAPSP
ncbi:MAG: hypothetical protein L3K11_00845 [Thermoplasmata archaeon]|nr:hypothetical protein [Thermoplasmata archaeon]